MQCAHGTPSVTHTIQLTVLTQNSVLTQHSLTQYSLGGHTVLALFQILMFLEVIWPVIIFLIVLFVRLEAVTDQFPICEYSLSIHAVLTHHSSYRSAGEVNKHLALTQYSLNTHSVLTLYSFVLEFFLTQHQSCAGGCPKFLSLPSVPTP